jgi:septal ring factor EnvC (AmiA/AmiB activator)
MKKTPENISRARQEASKQAELWRAEIAATRREITLTPDRHAERERRIAYAQAQIAEIAKELKALRRKGKKPFWSK